MELTNSVRKAIFFANRKRSRDGGRDRGMTMPEVLVAAVVLIVGMLGSMMVIATSISSNGRNRTDTTGTMLAQMMLGKINALPANSSVTSFTVADCASPPNTLTVSTVATTAGSGATVISAGVSTGQLDFSQPYSSVPAGYAMKYVACDGATYDVRWNLKKLSSLSKLVTVSSRQIGAGTAGGSSLKLFARPLTLRTIEGS